MVARNKESPRAHVIPEWGTGLGGFGDEAHGKILPCHRVREDGLMRISCKTVRCLPIEMVIILIDDMHVAQ